MKNMNIVVNIIGKESELVSSMFLRWDRYMEQHVEFWQLPGEFDVHTQGHAERVLLLALKIGERRGLNDRLMTALCLASIFHDTRRKDNYMDTGHGDRAAEYYKDFCGNGDLEFLPETYTAIKFHDRDDRLGEDYIRQEAPKNLLSGQDAESAIHDWTEVYHDFKDADALDRLRLGPWALDPRFLRSDEAKSLMPFAQDLVNKTIDPAELKKVMDATRPFAKKFSENK